MRENKKAAAPYRKGAEGLCCRLCQARKWIGDYETMKNILVTGGAGFIGSNFVRYLLRAEPTARVIDLDLLTYAGNLENLKELPDPDRHVFVRGDICDRPLVDKLLRGYQVDTIVNFAAESHVDRSILGPAPFIATNITGTFTLLEAARRYWLEEQTLPHDEIRFHHISTDEVFGSLEAGQPPFQETTPYAPRSPYSASKAASDHLVRAYQHTYDLPTTISNCSNNYGPYQYPEKLIPLMILNALKGRPLPIYGDGQQIRDWLYVEDHCQAIHMVLVNGKAGETYNIGGNNQPKNIEIVQHICSLLDERHPEGKPHTALLKHVQDRPGHDRRYEMDIRKIQLELGWKPSHTWQEGLRITSDWYLEHLDWVEHIGRQQNYERWLEQNYAGR